MVVKVCNLDSCWKVTVSWPCVALKVCFLDTPQKVDKENMSQNWIWTWGNLLKCVWIFEKKMGKNGV